MFDGTFQRGDLAADAVDGRLLGRDPGARGIHRDAIVAIVDAEDDLALLHNNVVTGNDRGDVAGDARAQHGVVGADIGIVGRDVEPPDEDVIDGVAGGGERKQRDHAHHDEFALARFRRSRHGSSRARSGQWRSGGIARGQRTSGLDGMPLGFVDYMRAKLFAKMSAETGRGIAIRRARLRPDDAGGLVSRCGHDRPPQNNIADTRALSDAEPPL